MKVMELTVEQLKTLIEDAIDAKLEEYFGDPDQGLELREEVKKELKKSLASVKKDKKTVPFDKLAKEMSIEMEE